MSLLPVSATAALLSVFATAQAPWLAIEAGSDQRQPVYLGKSPREISLSLSHPEANGKIRLPSALRDLAHRKIRTLARKIGLKRLEVEAWPAQNDQGKRTWALARWRKSADQAWQWIEAAEAPSTEARGEDPAIFVPQLLRPWIEDEASQIFDDVLIMDDLYTKPVFGDCIWASEDGTNISAAWLPPLNATLDRRAILKEHRTDQRLVCHVLPQPARMDGRPFTMVIGYDEDVLRWPANISWDTRSAAQPTALSPPRLITQWPANFNSAYQDDVRALSGEKEAVFPISGRKVRFVRKNSADPGHQLGELVEYLEERYAMLGIQTHRQSFVWRGIPQANLIAVIPGSNPDASAHPILMADHIDTAFCEDTFATSKERISAPGADDNVTAIAALLRAAEVLAKLRPRSDIWLVHLTGEEFPSDDLGARRFVSDLLARGQDIGGLVLMDMIGHHKRADGLFQISAGDSAASLRMASIALGSALKMVPESMIPVVRTRFDDRTYLYNTDGIVFSDSGFPVILFNEHLNNLENLSRAGYHQTTDVAGNLDFDYAAWIARVAIQTSATLADALRR